MDINYIRMGDYYIPDLTLPEENHVKPGQSKGKWNLPADWFEKDKALDKAIEEDFYADSL